MTTIATHLWRQTNQKQKPQIVVSRRGRPRLGCDDGGRGLAPLRHPAQGRAGLPGAGGGACQEAPNQHGGESDEDGRRDADAGVLQEPVRARFHPARYASNSHQRDEVHPER